MRLLLTLLYITLGMALFLRQEEDPNPALEFTALLLLFLSSLLLFNRGSLRKLSRQSYSRYLKDLATRDKLETVTCHVTRACHYEDLSTGRLAYFLEVDDGQILCLHGQYLYEYANGGNKPGKIRHQHLFPSRELQLTRLKKNQALLEMRPQGGPVESAAFAQPSRQIIQELNIPLHDGALITHISYDTLLTALRKNPLDPQN